MSDAPYLSLQRFPGDGVTTDFEVSFAGNRPDSSSGTTPYISADDIEAYEIIPATLLTAEVRINREVTVLGPNQFRIAPAVAVGRILVVRRKTEQGYPLVDFSSLQAVSEFDLDQSNRQMVFLAQEATDQARLAEETAQAAETIAYTSVNNATEALATANRAETKGNTAIAAANAAGVQAANAVNTANAANQIAAQANSTANEADETANFALNTADSAVIIAGDAATAAGVAVDTANLASSTANGAVDTALAAAADAALALEAADGAEAAAIVAQNAAQSTEGLAATADANATEALNTANAIDGKATQALEDSAEALETANTAMTLITDAGVSTFNGRAGVVEAQAGDYTAAMVEWEPGITVKDAIEDVQEYTDVLTVHVNSEVARISNQFSQDLTSALEGKLGVNAQAVDSQKLGGQIITYFATAQQLNAVNWAKLGVNEEAVSAAKATKLATPRTINGVNFDGTANITVSDGTKLPLSGGTLTGVLGLRASVTLDGQSGNGLHSTFNGQWWRVGARNSSYTHYESSTGNHYFYGNVIAQSNITAYSDIRLKTDIGFIRDALSKLAQLGGYTYVRTDVDDERQAGVIAQQVQKVLPEAVRENKEDGMLSVSYNGVIALLIEAVNELAQEVKELRNGIAK